MSGAETASDHTLAEVKAYIKEQHVQWHFTLNNTLSARPDMRGGKVIPSVKSLKTCIPLEPGGPDFASPGWQCTWAGGPSFASQTPLTNSSPTDPQQPLGAHEKTIIVPDERGSWEAPAYTGRALLHGLSSSAACGWVVVPRALDAMD